jgi:hypothetical protein
MIQDISEGQQVLSRYYGSWTKEYGENTTDLRI